MFIDKIKNISNNFAWPLLGFVLAVIFGSITIYTEFFRDDRPSIQFEILSNSSVLDVREEVSDLEIIYDGNDLRRSGQSLRVLVVRVSNTGGDDILNSFYDDNAPLGFSVENGEIVSVEVENASEDYLRDQLELSISGLSQVVFSPVILGQNSYFLLRILVIHTESLLPRVRPIGRVARVSSVSLVEAQELRPESFWSQTFGGSIWNQVIRLFAYSIALILLFLLVIFPISSISDALATRRRKRKVELFKKNSGHDFRDEDDTLFKNYIITGSFFLREVDSLLSEGVNLDRIAEESKKGMDTSATVAAIRHPSQLVLDEDVGRVPSRWLHLSLANTLFREGIIEKVDGHHRVNSRFEKIFREFQTFLSLIAE